MQRDARGFAVITNLRAGLYFETHEDFQRIGDVYHAKIRRTLIDVLTKAGANWLPSTHRCFPAAFRIAAFQLLLCNQRWRNMDQIHLRRDPLFLILKMLASMYWMSEDDQVAECKRILLTTYEKWSEAQLFRECETHGPGFASWCMEKLGVNIRKRGRKPIAKEKLQEFLVDLELGELY